MSWELRAFVVESNLIEGIDRAPTADEITAHEQLLALDAVAVGDLEVFADAVAGAVLRRQVGQDVTVGGHFPPRGGPGIESDLRTILLWAAEPAVPPQRLHVAYELLHPFTDGNGRSGRALWAWHMRLRGGDPFLRTFLHSFYYQTLNAAR